ncbi:MAG TPA: hypothetical protein VHY09_05255, partial [Candidatus Methylacidiphilales bacterium]|nr:hypothetical protein [Candidatus Methylacidiphilales bacterium]
MAKQEQGFGEQRNQFEATSAQFRVSVESSEKLFASLGRQTEEQAQTFGDLVKASKEQMASIENSFKEQMRLKAPVEYWSKKAQQHN